MPDMNPVSTIWGRYAMYRPTPDRPNRIWIAPAIATMIASSASVAPPAANMLATMTAKATEGPLTSAFVPPNSAARMPTTTAQCRPAIGPMPETIPNAMQAGA